MRLIDDTNSFPITLLAKRYNKFLKHLTLTLATNKTYR